MSKAKSFSRTLTNVIMYLLFAVLILGAVYGVLKLLNKEDGMYVVYGDSTINSSTSGISIDWADGSEGVTFRIENSDGWGAYTVDGCTVKIIPNVTGGNDFEFTVNGGTAAFGNEDDLTAAFTEDYKTYGGNGLAVNSDGEFTLYFIEYSSGAMSEILSRVYGGSDVTITGGEINILSGVYFAISVTSPDGGTTITIPFSVYVTSYSVSYTLTGATASDDNATKIVAGEGATLQFSVETGYVLPDEITVTGATLDCWDSSSGTAVISGATGSVSVTVTALKVYSITYSLYNVTASADNAATITENGSAELTFTAADGYTLPTEFTVLNAKYSSWTVYSGTRSSITINNPTGDVVISMRGVIDSEYTLSGIWLFDSTLTSDGTVISGNFDCLFTSDGNVYSYMTVSSGLGENMINICYGSTYVFLQGSGWVDSAYRIINFGTDAQSVSEVLYNFVTTFATQYDSEPTLYSLSYSVSVNTSGVTEETVEYPAAAYEGESVTFSVTYGTYRFYVEIYNSSDGNAVIDYRTSGGTFTDEGYCSSGSGTFTFTMPAGNVLIVIYVDD